jgi:hypothetical protein
LPQCRSLAGSRLVGGRKPCVACRLRGFQGRRRRNRGRAGRRQYLGVGRHDFVPGQRRHERRQRDHLGVRRSAGPGWRIRRRDHRRDFSRRRHLDGFALWPSKASNFNVGHIRWKNGQGDVVKDYVDAFRSRGLLPGLYYSIWDTTQGVEAASLGAADLAYVRTQLTELLTNYGPIPVLVFDGWSWEMGHQAIAYQEIYELVKSLQPDCLVTDHTHMIVPWDVDVVSFEEPRGAWAPAGNTYPAQQGT